MRKRSVPEKIVFLILAVFFSALPAFAETIELVTYYPASSNQGDLCVQSVKVGTPYCPETLADGGVIIVGPVGIGLVNPQEQLEITRNFRLPPTTATTGIIMSGAEPFIHGFGIRNFFAGVDAGNLTMTGNENTAVGVFSLSSNTTGIQNTAVGFDTLRKNETGQRNAAFGNESLHENTIGIMNTGLGHNTLYYNTTGNSNTAIGYQAGVTDTAANVNTTGSNNTFIGFEAGPGTATQLDNATAIGNQALVSASNALVLGGTGANAVNVGIGTSDPQATLDVTSDGGAILVPRKTTAGDPAGVNGMIYYNANAQRFRTYQNQRWQSLDGGYILVYRDDFENNANGWGFNTRTTIGGATILGGYNAAGTGTLLIKTFNLTGIPHTQIKVELDYYAIDSWDGEWAYVYAEGSGTRALWNRQINQFDPGRFNFGGNATRTDGVYHAVLTGSHSTWNLPVTVGSTLDQATNDESFGIDNVEVWVR